MTTYFVSISCWREEKERVGEKKKKLGESVFPRHQDSARLASLVHIKPIPVANSATFVVTSPQACRLPKECLLLPPNLRKLEGGEQQKTANKTLGKQC